MSQKKTEQAPISPDASWEEMVASSKDVPELLPKLKFGEKKTDEGRVDLVFTEDQPRVIEYDDPYNDGKKAHAFAINVRVIDGPEAGSSRALIMPKRADHGLTRGITGLAKKGGLRLSGRAVRVEYANYNHKRFGLTRGFTVSEITPPASEAP